LVRERPLGTKEREKDDTGVKAATGTERWTGEEPTRGVSLSFTGSKSNSNEKVRRSLCAVNEAQPISEKEINIKNKGKTKVTKYRISLTLLFILIHRMIMIAG
jgi:hypothetical protein